MTREELLAELRELERLYGEHGENPARGAERLALGSDYPFPLGEDRPGALIESLADLSHESKSQLLYKTAQEFLGLG